MIFKTKGPGGFDIDIDVDIKWGDDITEVRFVFIHKSFVRGNPSLREAYRAKGAILYLGGYPDVVDVMGAFDFSLHGLPRKISDSAFTSIPQSELVLYYHTTDINLPTTQQEAFQRLEEAIIATRVKARLEGRQS